MLLWYMHTLYHDCHWSNTYQVTPLQCNITVYIHYTHKCLWSVNSADTVLHSRDRISSQQACARTQLTFPWERNSMCEERTIFPQDPENWFLNSPWTPKSVDVQVPYIKWCFKSSLDYLYCLIQSYGCSATKPCLTLCNPMDGSMTGFPVLHYLLEFSQTHVHWVSDAIQPSHPLSTPSPAFNYSQQQDPFQWVSSLHQEAKVLELQLQEQSFQWIFRVDFL